MIVVLVLKSKFTKNRALRKIQNGKVPYQMGKKNKSSNTPNKQITLGLAPSYKFLPVYQFLFHLNLYLFEDF